VSFSFLQAKLPLTITWASVTRHLTQILSSGLPDTNSLHCANTRRVWMTAIAPITSHTKTWSH